MSQIRNAVGLNIREIRQKKGWSQEKLAVRSKLSSDYMGRLERGEVNISIEALYRISRSLKVPFAELVKGIE